MLTERERLRSYTIVNGCSDETTYVPEEFFSQDIEDTQIYAINQMALFSWIMAGLEAGLIVFIGGIAAILACVEN